MSRSESLSSGRAPADERVRHHDRAGAAAGVEVGADPAHGLGQRRLVAALAQRPRLAERLGVEVGQAVDRDGTVLVLQQDRGADAGRVGAQVDPGAIDEPGAEPEPASGVVVAAGHHDACAGRREPGEGLVGQGHGVDRRQRPVVDVAGHQHHVDALTLDDLEQVVDVRRLVRQHPLPVERPAQVPVGGVEQAHATTVGASTDNRVDPRRHRPARLVTWSLLACP